MFDLFTIFYDQVEYYINLHYMYMIRIFDLLVFIVLYYIELYDDILFENDHCNHHVFNLDSKLASSIIISFMQAHRLFTQNNPMIKSKGKL